MNWLISLIRINSGLEILKDIQNKLNYIDTNNDAIVIIQSRKFIITIINKDIDKIELGEPKDTINRLLNEYFVTDYVTLITDNINVQHTQLKDIASISKDL